MIPAQVDEWSTIEVDFIPFFLGELLTGEADGLFCLKQMFMQCLPRDTNNYLK